MTWADLTANWSAWFRRFQSRYPNLDEGAMPYLKTDRSRFEAYLADTHDLTLGEAHEELNDFLFVEALARDAFDIRAGANG